MTDKLDLTIPNPYMPMSYGDYMGMPLIDIMRKNKESRKYIQVVHDETINTYLKDSIRKAIILFVHEREEIRKHGRDPRKVEEKAQA